MSTQPGPSAGKASKRQTRSAKHQALEEEGEASTQQAPPPREYVPMDITPPETPATTRTRRGRTPATEDPKTPTKKTRTVAGAVAKGKGMEIVPAPITPHKATGRALNNKAPFQFDNLEDAMGTIGLDSTVDRLLEGVNTPRELRDVTTDFIKTASDGLQTMGHLVMKYWDRIERLKPWEHLSGGRQRFEEMVGFASVLSLYEEGTNTEKRKARFHTVLVKKWGATWMVDFDNRSNPNRMPKDAGESFYRNLAAMAADGWSQNHVWIFLDWVQKKRVQSRAGKKYEFFRQQDVENTKKNLELFLNQVNRNKAPEDQIGPGGATSKQLENFTDSNYLVGGMIGLSGGEYRHFKGSGGGERRAGTRGTNKGDVMEESGEEVEVEKGAGGGM